MTPTTVTNDLDVAYAVEQLQAHVPAEEVLLQIYNRALDQKTATDPFNYSLGVLEKACIDLDLNFDSTRAGEAFQRHLDQSPEPSHSTANKYSTACYGNLDGLTAAELQTIAALYESLGQTVHSPDVASGIYRGRVVQRSHAVTVQQTGPDSVTLHLNRDLAAACQSGQNCAVRYSAGTATLKAIPEAQTEQERDRRR